MAKFWILTPAPGHQGQNFSLLRVLRVVVIEWLVSKEVKSSLLTKNLLVNLTQ